MTRADDETRAVIAMTARKPEPWKPARDMSGPSDRKPRPVDDSEDGKAATA